MKSYEIFLYRDFNGSFSCNLKIENINHYIFTSVLSCNSQGAKTLNFENTWTRLLYLV